MAEQSEAFITKIEQMRESKKLNLIMNEDIDVGRLLSEFTRASV